MRILLLLTLSISACAAQVKLTIAVPDGRTSFYLDETIPVVLTFEGLIEKTHFVRMSAVNRPDQWPGLDEFTLDPAEGVEDPFAHWPHGSKGVAGSSGHWSHFAPKVEVTLHLNEWFRFRAPGRYTVQLKTRRAQKYTEGTEFEPLPLESNPMEIELRAPPAGWAAETVARAVATLEKHPPEAVNPDVEQARLALKYLGTPGAARALARHSTRSNSPAFQSALRMSPHPKAALQEMERLLPDAQTPIHITWLYMLSELASRVEQPETRPGPRIDARYLALAQSALQKKEGAARFATAATLFHLRAPVPPELLREIYLSSPAATLDSQYSLLTSLWPIVASPEIGPFLDSMLPDARGHVRRVIYQRLHEIDPETTRRRLIDDLRQRPFDFGFFTTELPLPAGELPELDERLIELIETQNPPWLFIARFGSRNLLPAVLAALDRHPPVCNYQPFLYLIRFDAEGARRRIEALRSQKEPVCGSFGIPGNPGHVLSEPLEDFLIDELATGDSKRRAYAAMTLFRHGSARARQPLWSAMERWRASITDPSAPLLVEASDEETYLAMAISGGPGWVATPADLDRLLALSVSESRRNNIRSHRDSLGRPVQLHYSITTHFGEIGLDSWTFSLDSGLRERLLLYPPEREFVLRLSHRQTWFIQRLESRLQTIFDEAGRKLRVEDELPNVR